MRITTWLRIGIIGGLAISVIVLIYFLAALCSHGYFLISFMKDDSILDESFTGQVGDFIGGVVGTFLSLASILLLILTLVEQQKENRKDSFEQTLSSMIDRYNSITFEIRYREIHGNIIEGKEAIALMLDDYIYILKKVIGYVDGELIKDENLRKHFDQESACRFAVKLAYGYFMYGYKNYFMSREEGTPIYELNLNVTTAISMANKDSGLWNKDHSSQLGHYFRCIFYIVKFIASQNWLTEDEKYQYVKQLRSLMSDKEQILLYYNALSALGEPWITPLGKESIKDMCYMARFRMIKNIPYYYEYVGINPKQLFIVEYNAYKKTGKKFFELELNEHSSAVFFAFASKNK